MTASVISTVLTELMREALISTFALFYFSFDARMKTSQLKLKGLKREKFMYVLNECKCEE